ncbi:LysR substrate-binding domain-containing protein [Pandoraea apista]|uniref:LysR substrate-binding domain-containing protein n=1 Tax=Pandoraea apista TaxID=93218 RepID=UPI000F6809B7|nr:LysR substrate-binding domain-containing protein [Pandoraea apista]RSD17641.1 LysR family transcriptional regulator [Pandoraea apista]RUN90240.1 LysR family transcriptional regulator [Pandoraea apista]RUN91702.1 LysR family transcriptional regulator [Pandoraea apista]
MIQIEDLRLIEALAQSASLSAAARMLNVTPPALSARLRKLEATLGLALATRTSRQLSLTAEGERLAREGSALLAQLDALPEAFRREDKRLTGTLRIAAPFGYGRHHVAPALARFAQLHPELRLQLDLRETPWPDKHDSDAVIHVGAVRDSSWIARALAPNERWLCASPAYLKQHGIPATPGALLRHRCICIRENDEDVTLWRFPRAAKSNAAAPRRSSTRDSVRVVPAYTSNDGSVAREWAEQGLGLVLRSEWDTREAVAAGKLVRVLADWAFDSAPVTLLVPTRRGRTARLQALMAFLEDALGVSTPMRRKRPAKDA